MCFNSISPSPPPLVFIYLIPSVGTNVRMIFISWKSSSVCLALTPKGQQYLYVPSSSSTLLRTKRCFPVLHVQVFASVHVRATFCPWFQPDYRRHCRLLISRPLAYFLLRYTNCYKHSYQERETFYVFVCVGGAISNFTLIIFRPPTSPFFQMSPALTMVNV